MATIISKDTTVNIGAGTNSNNYELENATLTFQVQTTEDAKYSGNISGTGNVVYILGPADSSDYRCYLDLGIRIEPPYPDSTYKGTTTFIGKQGDPEYLSNNTVTMYNLNTIPSTSQVILKNVFFLININWIYPLPSPPGGTPIFAGLSATQYSEICLENGNAIVNGTVTVDSNSELKVISGCKFEINGTFEGNGTLIIEQNATVSIKGTCKFSGKVDNQGTFLVNGVSKNKC